MDLERDIKEIRTAIKNGAFANEAAVSQGVVLRLLNSLGWPAYDTQTVSPQYGLEGRRVDYALCHPPGKPISFIEVKNIACLSGCNPHPLYVGCAVIRQARVSEWKLMF